MHSILVKNPKETEERLENQPLAKTSFLEVNQVKDVMEIMDKTLKVKLKKQFKQNYKVQNNNNKLEQLLYLSLNMGHLMIQKKVKVNKENS